MCKHSDVFSLAVLIGRGLVLFNQRFILTLFSFQGVFTKRAPLAQLVEHLTLNQGVQGSSP